MTLEEAYQRCHELTRDHYENFPVARLVPGEIRPYVSAVYAFSRTADDIADEGWGENGSPTPEERVAALDAFEEQLEASAAGKSLKPDTEWIFLALADTIKQRDVPIQLFRDLLSAFKQDCVKLHYTTHEEVLDYCKRSANPIGRLVLTLHGLKDDQFFAWSDSICTALQLANFWQDVGVDIKKDGRIYIPEEDWNRFGVNRTMFDQTSASTQMRECLKFQVERTQKLFDEGRPLGKKLPFPLNLEIKLTWHGGATILKKIAKQDYDTLSSRPKLRKTDVPALMAKAVFG